MIHGDCREAMAAMPAERFDACVTDPPYELGFMGKSWDQRGVAFDPATWTAVLRALKPGAHLLAFGGTRTFHRMAVAIEDAGFELRDTVMWMYGTGFPKSHDVSKGIDKAAGAEREVVGFDAEKYRPNRQGRALVNGATDAGGFHADNGATITAPATEAARRWHGWGTALKPAWEPIIVARKPLIGTVAENVLQHGTGALNIDGCRVMIDPVADASQLRTMTRNTRDVGDGWGMSSVHGDVPQVVRPDGRWPANVIHDGSDEVLAAFPTAPGQQGAVSGGEPSEASEGRVTGRRARVPSDAPRGDTGSAARFFYSAKASKADRAGSKHPTVKPLALMRYLCRLVTPPGGRVLDPFAGSGTTGEAALQEGFLPTLIEAEAEYVADIQRRISMVAREQQGVLL